MDERRPFLDGMGRRILGALRLDPDAFEEVAEDTRATPQVVLIVLLVGTVGVNPFGFGVPAYLNFALGIGWQVIEWFLWTGVTYLIAIRISEKHSRRPDWEEVMRSTGIAQVPGLLILVTLLIDPISGLLIFWTAKGWQVTAMVVAVRANFEFRKNIMAALAATAGFVVVLTMLIGVPLAFNNEFTV